MIDYSNYNDKPVIILKRNENDRFPFSFGLSKAKLIISHIEGIINFVKDQDPTYTFPNENILKRMIGKGDKNY